MSETFTMSGWEIRLRDMKRVFNRLALLGVNAIQLMGARYDFMPGVDSLAMTNNWQNPLFRHYGELSKYVSSLQYLVSHSETVPGTLLLYPMTTARVRVKEVNGKDLKCTAYNVVLTEDGLDALLSTVQMPTGIPVATVAINGGANAGLLAAKILATKAPVNSSEKQ